MASIEAVLAEVDVLVLVNATPLESAFALAYIGLLIVAAVVAARSSTLTLPRWLKWPIILGTAIYSVIVTYRIYTILAS